MDEIRERRGLVYYAACSADVRDIAGQFVIEASLAPAKVQEFATEVTRLLRAHADSIDPLHLERARNQIAVRRLEVEERPFRRIEDAVQDVFALGRVRSRVEVMDLVRRHAAGRARSVRAHAGLAGVVAMAGRSGVFVVRPVRHTESTLRRDSFVSSVQGQPANRLFVEFPAFSHQSLQGLRLEHAFECRSRLADTLCPEEAHAELGRAGGRHSRAGAQRVSCRPSINASMR